MKKLIITLLSLVVIANASSCSSGSIRSSVGENASVSQGAVSAAKLTNHMTENERSKIKLGELTVFDHEQKQEEAAVPSEGVYLELWSYDDNLAAFKKEYDENPEYFEDMTFEEAVKFKEKYFEDIHAAFADGEPVVTYELDPVIGYDGGELTIKEPTPVYYVTDDEGNNYYIDGDKNKLPDEEAIETIKRYADEQPTLTFKSFEEFKPYIKERIDFMVYAYPLVNPEYQEAFKKETYDEIVKLWQAVINKSYKTLPVGTYDKWEAQISVPQTSVWEIDHDKIKAIEQYVREYNIYDQQLDTNFVVHVTLPPAYDPQKTYPAYYLTDGVWRFNNCADMRKTMEEGRAADVILVSIGYDYSMDGMDDTNRKKYFCERCEDFINFITDDLAPYLCEEYSIDCENSTLFGHSLGGTFAHYALFNSDRYENQPFGIYIIGSPAFWSPGFLPYNKDEEFRDDYGYFKRNETLNKRVFVCGGADEDPVYQEYYGENESTLQGIDSLMKRLEEHGVSTAECKIYPDSQHYQFIPEMLIETLEKYYPVK